MFQLIVVGQQIKRYWGRTLLRKESKQTSAPLSAAISAKRCNNIVRFQTRSVRATRFSQHWPCPKSLSTGSGSLKASYAEHWVHHQFLVRRKIASRIEKEIEKNGFGEF